MRKSRSLTGNRCDTPAIQFCQQLGLHSRDSFGGAARHINRGLGALHGHSRLRCQEVAIGSAGGITGSHRIGDAPPRNGLLHA